VPDFPRILLEHYLQDSGELMGACTDAAATDRMDVVLRCVHTLKSSSAEVGALALADLANVIETRLRTSRGRISKGELERLQAEYRRARGCIDEYLRRTAGLTREAM
jgi:HPt (histidine-containing phosphotransfer) domain-containing protein